MHLISAQEAGRTAQGFSANTCQTPLYYKVHERDKQGQLLALKGYLRTQKAHRKSTNVNSKAKSKFL